MLEIDVLAVVPGLLEGPFSHSILHRAEEKKLLKVRVIDLRTFGYGNHKQIDDYAFGGGAGMVLMAQPLSDAIRMLQSEGEYDEIIYLTPDGKPFNQHTANHLSPKSRLLLICGHYKGIDERIREKFVTMEISIGDYVLSGGELAAAVVVDVATRGPRRISRALRQTRGNLRRGHDHGDDAGQGRRVPEERYLDSGRLRARA